MPVVRGIRLTSGAAKSTSAGCGKIATAARGTVMPERTPGAAK